MFGYVRIDKSELKFGDYERYEGVYCTLCRQLGKRYGMWMRFTLSYDFTYLALLGMALAEDCGGFCKKHCPYRFWKKKMCCTDTSSVDYAADAAVLLVWYKLDDVLRDDGFWKRLGARCLRLLFRRAYRKAAALRPAWDAEIARWLQEQEACEREKTPSPDRAAEPSAQILAMLARDLSDCPEQRRVLDRVGYFLGRYVYLVDALEDLPQDIRKSAFNPFLSAKRSWYEEDPSLGRIRAYARESLFITIAECRKAYELLSIRRWDAVLRNVLEQGMPQTVEQVMQDKKERKQR